SSAVETTPIVLPSAGVGSGSDHDHPVLPEGRPSRRSGRRRSIAPKKNLPTPPLSPPPPAETTTPAVEIAPGLLPLAVVGFRSDHDHVMLPDGNRPPRRSGRRRSIAPKMNLPTPPPSPQPPAAVTTTPAEEVAPGLLPSVGAGSGRDHNHAMLPGGFPPRRSGRRRSIAPKNTSSTPPPPPSPATTAPAAETDPELMPSAGGGSGSDQDDLLLPEGRPPRRSGRRRSVAVLRRRPQQQQQQRQRQHYPLAVPTPSADDAVIDDNTAAATTSALLQAMSISDVTAFSSPSSSSKNEGPIVEAGISQVVAMQRVDALSVQAEEPTTKRRSTRRKSMRGSRSGGALLEDDLQAAAPPAFVMARMDSGGERLLTVKHEESPDGEGANTMGAAAAVEGGGVHVAIMGGLLNKCMGTVRAVTAPDDRLLPLLELLAGALVDAEACVLEKDERRAGVGAGNQETIAGRRKVVRLCAYDFSTVGMPVDTIVGSDIHAQEVVQRLERVIGAQQDLWEALRISGGGGGGVGSVGGAEFTAWKVLLRELRATVAAADAFSGETGPGGSGAHSDAHAPPPPPPPPPAAVAVAVAAAAPAQGGHRRGGFVPARRQREMSRAAVVLLGELEPLEKLEGPIGSPVRDRLAGMLASLIRFNLRIRLDAPPEKLTRAPEVLPSCREASYREEKRRAEVPPPSHFSKVHKVVEGSESDAAFGAAFSKALVRLHEFSSEEATDVFTAAEAFEASDHTRLAESNGCPLRVESARQLLSAAGYLVEAVRARKFILSLLEFEGVQDAIAEAGGWGNVEAWACALKKLEGSAHIDAPLTLLVDVGELQDWLRSECTWRDAAERAEEVLQRLLDLPPFKEVVERAKQRWMCPAAYQLLRQEMLEARERLTFPEVKTACSATVEAGVVTEPVIVGEHSSAKG
ncbi:unnamed protein product, partial [Pylaiella littoralis]